VIRVTCWNEYYKERVNETCKKAYPNGIHEAIKEVLSVDERIICRTATPDEPECGLTQEALDATDVLIWWGHINHHLVPDEVAARVVHRVLNGMGFIALHSGHMSKPFMKLMGTSCDLRWRESEDHERIWCVNPGHPICAGLPPYFEIPKEETYGEYFDIPKPDEVVFIGWFSGGEVFRSGCCFTRGAGRIFYFQPGHETSPVYKQKEVGQVIRNAVHWAAPAFTHTAAFGEFASLEKK